MIALASLRGRKRQERDVAAGRELLPVGRHDRFRDHEVRTALAQVVYGVEGLLMAGDGAIAGNDRGQVDASRVRFAPPQSALNRRGAGGCRAPCSGITIPFPFERPTLHNYCPAFRYLNKMSLISGI